MSDIKCCFCNGLFLEGEEVEFKGIAYYKLLKSKIHYAISYPHDVFSLRHYPECPHERKVSHVSE